MIIAGLRKDVAHLDAKHQDGGRHVVSEPWQTVPTTFQGHQAIPEGNSLQQGQHGSSAWAQRENSDLFTERLSQVAAMDLAYQMAAHGPKELLTERLSRDEAMDLAYRMAGARWPAVAESAPSPYPVPVEAPPQPTGYPALYAVPSRPIGDAAAGDRSAFPAHHIQNGDGYSNYGHEILPARPSPGRLSPNNPSPGSPPSSQMLFKERSTAKSGTRNLGGRSVTGHFEMTTSVGKEHCDNSFIVNSSRLIAMQEKLQLLHEFVKSTAIAALTLVAAGSWRQLMNTILFLFATLLLYADHEEAFDRLNIVDMISLIPLNPQEPHDNPNSILKSMTVNKSRNSAWRNRAVHVFELGVMAGAWFVCIYPWFNTVVLDDQPNMDCFWFTTTTTLPGVTTTYSPVAAEEPEQKSRFRNFVDRIIEDEDDLEALSMQLTVFTFMYVLTICFSAIHRYETKGVMPHTKAGEVWDVRRDGIPPKFNWLGLPSMWFSNEEVHSRLLTWIDNLHFDHRVIEVYPEEIALYALQESEEKRGELAVTLKDARMWDSRVGGCINDQRLDIDLVFFNTNMVHKGFHFPGDFVAFDLERGGGDHRSDAKDRMRNKSVTTYNSSRTPHSQRNHPEDLDRQDTHRSDESSLSAL